MPDDPHLSSPIDRPGFVPPRIPPGPGRPGLVGFLRAMVTNPVGAMPSGAYTEPVTVLRLGGRTLAVVSDPPLVDEIFRRRVADFPKALVDARVLEPAFGASLLTAEGEDWRWKRQLAAATFTPAALARRVPDMVAPFQALATAWSAAPDRGSVDIVSAMTAATFEVICRTLVPDPAAVDFPAISRAIEDYLASVTWVITYASLDLPRWLPYPGRARLLTARDRMRAAVADLIAARRAALAATTDADADADADGAPAPADLSAELIRARDPETGRPLGDRDLTDMILTLIAAGHETSANGLVWTLYCLAMQPAAQDALAAEVRAVAGARPVTAADLPALRRTEAFIKETMRLFPPIPLLTRRTLRAERLGEIPIPADSQIFVPVYAIHRHRALWRDPDRFAPARFLDGDGAAPRHRMAYLPFGAGPRICLGATFAMMEMVAGLATLVQSVRFTPAADTRCEPISRVALRPNGGLRLAVHRRAD